MTSCRWLKINKEGHWGKGWLLPFSAAAAAKSLQSCPIVRPHRRQPTRLPCPWDSPGKNTGVGFHFLLQCMKVESESEVTQLCPTLSHPMDCSLPGSSIHGIFQARVLEWGAIAFSVPFSRSWKRWGSGFFPSTSGRDRTSRDHFGPGRPLSNFWSTEL